MPPFPEAHPIWLASLFVLQNTSEARGEISSLLYQTLHELSLPWRAYLIKKETEKHLKTAEKK